MTLFLLTAGMAWQGRSLRDLVPQSVYLLDDTIRRNVACGVPEGVIDDAFVQRQRIAIARPLYFDPQVLVLDEAKSSLDMDTEREVMAAVEALHGTKTLVIAAHRLSTVENCDVLHRIEDGTIVRSGSFADVVAGSPVTA